MPLYEYECTKCNEIWKEMRKIAERNVPTEAPCPHCESENTVRKIITGAPSIGDPVRLGIKQPDGGMKEVLQKVQEKSPNAEVKDYSTLTRL